MVAIQTRGRRPIPAGLKKLNFAQRAEIERQKNMAEMRLVMSQPHRRGFEKATPDVQRMLESPLGRFVLRYRLKSALFEAGKEYSLKLRRLWAAKGVPTDVSLGGGGGTGSGPSDATVRRWEREIEAIENELRRSLPQSRAYVAVRHLAIDEQELPVTAHEMAITGLMALAKAMEKDVGGHPF